MKLLFFALAGLMFVIEKKYGRRELPASPKWYLRSISFTLVQSLVVFTLHSSLDAYFEKHRLYNLDGINEYAATGIAFLVMTFVSYWQHRIKHKFPFLWNYLHQVHHSPTRIELLTSFYRNPFEIIINMLIMSTVLLLGVGANRDVALNVVLLLGIADMFYHWNVKTPYWIGFIIQRPESHGIHHLQGVHAYNYGDLALWDMMFGTFKNLRNFRGRCGFKEEGETKILSMLKGIDMSDGKYYHKKVKKNSINNP